VSRRALISLVVILACVPAKAETPKIELFDSPAEAVRDLLRASASRPRVLAFGEIHEVTGGPKATPAIRHFSDEMLAALPSPGELVVETWMTKGNCGAVEHQVAAQVEQMTKRPESTETDIVRLLRLGKAGGLRSHILELSCATYHSLQNKDGELDAVKLLGAVTIALRDSILALLRGGRDPVIVYGGALHNDRHPRSELQEFSFARPVERAAKQRYLEIDLYVPEYVEKDPAITGTDYWPKYLEAVRDHADKTARVRLAPGSYIIVFPRTTPPS
jgi:hypothetical protein